jgi:hypothetical protein
MWQKVAQRLLSAQKLDSAVIEIRSEWGADAHDHRAELRKAAAIAIKKTVALKKLFSIGDSQSLQDLSKTPDLQGLSISISHCKDAGGFVAAPRALGQIGFDIEIASRVRPDLMLRMSSPAEMSMAPSAAHLWVAKEATFKSLLGASQPPILSSIRVRSWLDLNEETFQFQAALENPNIGQIRGIVLQENHLILGFAQFIAQL